MKVSVRSICVAVALCIGPVPAISQTTAPFAETFNSEIGFGQTGVGVAWGDFDRDGAVDMFVTSHTASHTLYRNLGDGSFSRITAPFSNVGSPPQTVLWGDYDNDGDLDLFIAHDFDGANQLYRNNGAGSFTRIVSGQIVEESLNSVGAAWGDFDGDGFLDLFVANGGISGVQSNSLFRNNGNGTFSPFPSALNLDQTISGSWADYNNDGHLDIFLARMGGRRNQLFRNNGNGSFALATNNPVVLEGGSSVSGTWGDYDNDGFLDLFVANINAGTTNYLYKNLGNGNFTKILNSGIAADATYNGIWGDYDNDGWLDIFLARAGTNYLYRNNGNGAFERVSAPLLNGPGTSIGAAWADYNGDGFLDLAVATYSGGKNQVFRNLGNSNNWLRVRCIGQFSNRDGIGAKVRIRTAVNGADLHQLRQITGGEGNRSQSESIAHFGLGPATRVEELSVEWPSGLIQRFNQVPANHVLVVEERLLPVISARPKSAGIIEISFEVSPRFTYRIQSTSNLRNWELVEVLDPSESGTVSFDLPTAAEHKFYRIRVVPK